MQHPPSPLPPCVELPSRLMLSSECNGDSFKVGSCLITCSHSNIEQACAQKSVCKKACSFCALAVGEAAIFEACDRRLKQLVLGRRGFQESTWRLQQQHPPLSSSPSLLGGSRHGAWANLHQPKFPWSAALLALLLLPPPLLSLPLASPYSEANQWRNLGKAKSIKTAIKGQAQEAKTTVSEDPAIADAPDP